MRAAESGSHPLRPIAAPWPAVALVALGDALVFVLFSLAGRSAHGHAGSVVGVIGTALPFLAGWFVAAIPLGAYAREALPDMTETLQRTARAWIAGAVIALVIRSLLEHRIVPGAFIAVAVAFNLILLVCWRAAMAYFLDRQLEPSAGR